QSVEEPTARAGQHRRGIDQELVDEVFLQESRRESRSTLEHKRLHALGGEPTELVGERPAAKLEVRAFGERPPAEGKPSGLARRIHSAGVEAWIVDAYSPHPDGNGVRSRAQLVHAAAAGPTGGPAGSGPGGPPVP